MAREVELGAVRSRTVYAVPGKVQVRSKLAYVHAQGSQSNMKAVGARRLEQFRYFQILLDGCHERAIAKVEIVFFDAVDKNLHDKIFAAFLLDPLDDRTRNASGSRTTGGRTRLRDGCACGKRTIARCCCPPH